MNPKHAPALSSNTSASSKEDVNKALEEYKKAAMEQFLRELNALNKLNSRF